MKFDQYDRLLIGKGVTLKPYSPPKFIEREFLTEQELFHNIGTDLVIDCEAFPNYFIMGLKHVPSGKYFIIGPTCDPRFLSRVVMSYRTIGFNSINYDLPMLWAAYHNNNPLFLKDVSNALIYQNKRAKDIASEFGFRIFDVPERQHIDLINVCPLKRSLKMYGARLHSHRIQDLPIADDKTLTEEEKRIVDGYNCNDLDVTELIYKFKPMQERLQLRETLSIDYNLDLMSKSDAQMAEAVITQEVAKLNGRYSKRPTIESGTVYRYNCPHFLMFATPQMQELLERVKRAKFVLNAEGYLESPDELKRPVTIGKNTFTVGIGGLHSKDTTCKYVADENYKIIDRDMTSYYPALIINLGLYPIALGPNFLTVFKGFRDQRVKAKAAKNFAWDKGLKIFLNGASGKWSDFYSKLRNPDNTVQQNLTGQLTILMLVEMLECQGIQVISANTDGIVIYCHRDDELKLNNWILYFEQMTGFKTEETEYSAYYARDVNAYFAVKLDGSVKVKGPYSEVGSQSGTQLDNNPKLLICSDAIKALLASGTPIENTIYACKDITRFVIVRDVKGGAHKDGHYLGKVVRWAYYKNTYGTINYVLSGNKVPETEGAVPLQDLPDEFPVDKIDYDRYIQETKNILYDIGYLTMPKQVEFFA